jgi:SAM-dependent methyltransferase
MAGTDHARQRAFGQEYTLSTVDRLGTWLSARRVRQAVGTFNGKAIGDFGCGYDARLARTVLGEVSHAVLVDVSLAPDLGQHDRVTTIEGALPGALAEIPDASLDAVFCLSVLEHLWDPLATIRECRRTIAPDGLCLFNVPTWRGKRALELSAFRLGLSPREEMDDHKAYYDPRDLWPLLVRGGFVPHEIRCFKHKFGLNTFAVCQVGLLPPRGIR